MNTLAVWFFGAEPIVPVVLLVTGALTIDPTSAADSILCASATSDDAEDNDDPEVGGSAVIGAGADSDVLAETVPPPPPPPEGAAEDAAGAVDPPVDAGDGEDTEPPSSGEDFRASISFWKPLFTSSISAFSDLSVAS